MANPAQHRRMKARGGRHSASAIDVPKTAEVSRTELAFWAVLFVTTVAMLGWKHSAFFFLSWTDEQIHFYVARRMAEGAVLYRDISSARPPLVLFPVAWLVKMGCSPLFAGRALVLGTQLATAGLLFWGGWRLASWRAGALAALLFLSSPEAFDRIHYTGIHLVSLTAAACVLFSLTAHPLRAGLCLGLTLAADQHGLLVCGMVALLTIARRPRDALPFAVGALVIVAMVFGGVWVMGGRNLWESLVGIHLFHLRVGQGVSEQFWARFVPWLYEHGYLLVGAGLALLTAKRVEVTDGGPRPPASRAVRVILLVVGAHVAVVLAMKEAVFLYVVVIAPLLALVAGLGFHATVAWWRQRRLFSQARARLVSRLMLAGTAALVALTASGWAAARSHRERLDGRPFSFWPHVLHGQVARQQQLDVALRGIGDSMLPKQGTIFGEPTITTALALNTGRRVAGELADLNPSWIEAGAVKPEEVVSRIERDGVTAVISPPWGLVQDPYVKSYLFACYEKPKPFFPPPSGPGQGLPPFILVFTHIPGSMPCHVPPVR